MLERKFTRSCSEFCPISLRIHIGDVTQCLELVSEFDLERRTSRGLNREVRREMQWHRYAPKQELEGEFNLNELEAALQRLKPKRSGDRTELRPNSSDNFRWP